MDRTNATYVQVDTIKPDPGQPRKIFVKDHINGLASSIKIEGIINPIEIDEQMRIITGECRWRAAKQLGLDEVPVTINSSKLSSYERLRHQMAENVHQSGSTYDTMMNPIDTARGYAKLYELKYNKPYVPGTHGIDRDPETGQIEKGPFELIAEEIGINKHTVWEHLKLLDEPMEIQKAIQDGVPRTYFREADRAPEHLKDKIKDKIVGGEYNSREEVVQDVTLAKKIPDLAQIEIERERGKASVFTNKILNSVAKLALAMEKMPLSKVDIRERGIVEKQLNWIVTEIQGYLLDREEE